MKLSGTRISQREYEVGQIELRPVFVTSRFRECDPGLLEEALEFLTASLADIEKAVPSSAWAKIAKVPIWLEYEDRAFPGGCYHVSREWLLNNGYDPAKEKCVQFTKNIVSLRATQPMLILHELAHAYHDLALTYEDASILTAYERAKASGKYDSVARNTGGLHRAYAMVDHKEFFCELSEALFGVNDFFPFTRSELEGFDPESFSVVSAAWAKS